MKRRLRKKKYFLICNPIFLLQKKRQKQKQKQRKAKKKRKKAGDVSGITVDGIDNVMVSLGTCCHPLPGDKVIGIVNSGKGIVIHTANCIVAKQIAESAPGKLVKVDFLPSDKVYNAKIRVSIEDKPGMLANISSAIAKLKINIVAVQTRSLSGKAILDFVVQVKSRDELQKVIQTIKNVKGVLTIKRIYREKVQKVT